jgi:hypothetical protein
MKLNFHVYKTANLFYFVSSLTRWHFSTEERYINYWLKQTGPLNQKELIALDKFKKVLLGHNFGANYLGKPLLSYPDKKAMLEARKLLNEKDYDTLKSTFEIMTPRFEKIWKVEGSNLRKWQKQLSNATTSSENIDKDLSTFFGVKLKNKTTKVILIIGADVRYGGGGANSIPGCIEQVIGLGTKYVSDVLPTIWHEYIHDAYREPAKKIRDEYLKKHRLEQDILRLGLGGDPAHFINEGICSSLMPRGYLAIKYGYYRRYYLTENNKKLFTKSHKDAGMAIKYINLISYGFIRSYFDKGWPLDQRYVAKIHQGFNDYLNLMKAEKVNKRKI